MQGRVGLEGIQNCPLREAISMKKIQQNKAEQNKKQTNKQRKPNSPVSQLFFS